MWQITIRINCHSPKDQSSDPWITNPMPAPYWANWANLHFTIQVIFKKDQILYIICCVNEPYWNCPLSFFGTSRWELESWSAKSIEPCQTEQMCSVAWFYTDGNQTCHFGFGRIRVNMLLLFYFSTFYKYL